jgi:hypothetical protein
MIAKLAAMEAGSSRYTREPTTTPTLGTDLGCPKADSRDCFGSLANAGARAERGAPDRPCSPSLQLPQVARTLSLRQALTRHAIGRTGRDV